uniref:ATP-dependent RNA helicase n=1 Tax=Panagrolaimus sp. JU765 TaxID=591449 RepID=A0AC34QPY9_9BILA
MSRPVYRRYVRSVSKNHVNDAQPLDTSFSTPFPETGKRDADFPVSSAVQCQDDFSDFGNEEIASKPLLPAAYGDLNVAVTFCAQFTQVHDENDFLGNGEIQPLKYFSDNGFINPKIVTLLKNAGIEEFRPIQYVIFKIFTSNFPIPKNKADVIMLSPTGTGKTLAYLIPIIHSALARRQLNVPFAMIFVPTQTLAEAVKQQLDKLVSGLGLKTALFTRGSHQICYDFDIGVSTMGTYKRVFNDRIEKLKTLGVIVVDEADAILSDFPQCQMLMTLREFSRGSLLARSFLLSATCKQCFNRLVCVQNLFVIECGELNTVARTVVQRFIEVNSSSSSGIIGFEADKKFEIPPTLSLCPFDQLYVLLEKIKQRGLPMKTIVFCKRRNVAYFIAHKLLLMGFRAASISGKHDNNRRDELLKKFADGTIEVLVGTRLITRGIDYDVDNIVNYDLPLDVLEYVHRCGRAGRNGKTGTAYTFYDFKNFIDYNPTVIKDIALQIEKLIEANNFDYNTLPPSFQEYLENAVKNEIEAKREMYEQCTLDDNDF